MSSGCRRGSAALAYVLCYCVRPRGFRLCPIHTLLVPLAARAVLIDATGLQLAALQMAVFVPMAMQVSTLPFLPDLGEAHRAELIAGAAQIATVTAAVILAVSATPTGFAVAWLLVLLPNCAFGYAVCVPWLNARLGGVLEEARHAVSAASRALSNRFGEAPVRGRRGDGNTRAAEGLGGLPGRGSHAGAVNFVNPLQHHRRLGAAQLVQRDAVLELQLRALPAATAPGGSTPGFGPLSSKSGST